MKQKYTHLLFDLDHTLWDFNTNCTHTLQDLYQEYAKQLADVKFDDFLNHFLKINSHVWHLYDHNQITKEGIRTRRFRDLLNQFEINNPQLAMELEDKYVTRCPQKGRLLPHAIELLEIVKNDFTICLITNGFQETQEQKIKYAGLDAYFQQLFTLENTGYKKPDKNYFLAVLDFYKIEATQCLIIGDNPHTDVQGAHNSGIDCLWVNTQKYPQNMQSTYYVEHLKAAIELFEY